MTKKPVSKPAKVADELASARLPEKRLKERFDKIIKAVESHPDRSFPQMMQNRNDLVGLYRFTDNDRVDWQTILEPHYQATAERCRQADSVLIIEDSSTFSVTESPDEYDGLFELGSNDHGFLGHFSLAVSDDPFLYPLGLLNVEAVDPKSNPESTRATRFAYPDKPSLRWPRTVYQSVDRLSETTQRIHVQDRDGDSYEFMAVYEAMGEDFVIRSNYDRTLSWPGIEPTADERIANRLQEAVASGPFSFERTVQVSKRKHHKRTPHRQKKRHPQRKKRQAKLSVRTRRVPLARPVGASKNLPERIWVNAVEVTEIKPPEDGSEVHWRILTSLPIDSRQEVARIVDIYCARWKIEEFFKALKTGCAYKQRQLRSLHGLLVALAMLAPIAWHMLLVRDLARQPRKIKAKKVMRGTELEALQYRCKKAGLKLPKNPNIQQAYMAIAELGGHAHGTRRPPGWLVLSRGYHDVLDAEEMLVDMRR